MVKDLPFLIVVPKSFVRSHRAKIAGPPPPRGGEILVGGAKFSFLDHDVEVDVSSFLNEFPESVSPLLISHYIKVDILGSFCLHI